MLKQNVETSVRMVLHLGSRIVLHIPLELELVLYVGLGACVRSTHPCSAWPVSCSSVGAHERSFSREPEADCVLWQQLSVL